MRVSAILLVSRVEAFLGYFSHPQRSQDNIMGLSQKVLASLGFWFHQNQIGELEPTSSELLLVQVKRGDGDTAP